MSRPIDALLGNIDPLTGLRRGMVGGNASYMQSPVKVTGLPQIGNNTAYNTDVTMRSGNNIPVRPMTNAGVIAGSRLTMPTVNTLPVNQPEVRSGMSGLLGETFSDPRTYGLLGASAKMLEQSGYSTTPRTFGQIVGSGINAGLGAYQTALKNNRIRDQKNIQVVGGALVDYTDPNNPKILYETPSKTNKKTAFIKSTGQVVDYTDPLKPVVTNVEGYEVPKQKPDTKPLPPALQKVEEGDIEAVMSMKNINTDADKFYNFIQDGELEFGRFDNIEDAWKGWWGTQGREEELTSEFKIFIQKLANDSLKLAKGVQTEGDAERVGKELLSAYDQNNSRLIKNRLLKMQEINQRTINIRKALIKNRRISQNAKPFDFEIFNEEDIEFEVVKE